MSCRLKISNTSSANWRIAIKEKITSMKITKWLLLLFLGFIGLPLFAQPGLDEMSQAQQSLSQSFFSALDCALVLAAIFGIFGALRIYSNWQMGRPRITEEVAAWFLAAFFMVLAGVFLRAVFGI
jgi:hypothetical protein